MTATEKINAEMQKHPDDLYREIIGHYLINRMCATIHEIEETDTETAAKFRKAASALMSKGAEMFGGAA